MLVLIFKTISQLLLLLHSEFSSSQTAFSDFNLKITNVKSTATIRIAFYKKHDKFPDADKILFAKEIKPNKKGEFQVKWTDVPAGEYALAIYQDINENKKLETNLFGYPTEPFGFSKNVKPRFSAPKFEECKIQFNFNSNIFNIKLLD